MPLEDFSRDFRRDQEKEYDNEKWDLKFQNLWSMVIAADGDFETNMTLSEKLFYLVGQYNKEVSDTVCQIVNDFSLPEY